MNVNVHRHTQALDDMFRAELSLFNLWDPHFGVVVIVGTKIVSIRSFYFIAYVSSAIQRTLSGTDIRALVEFE